MTHLVNAPASNQYKPVPLDGGYGWVIVCGAFLIHVFIDGFIYSFGVLANPIIKDLQATKAETSAIVSLLSGLMLATGPLGSWSSNKLGCRLTALIGAVIAVIGCGVSYFATSIFHLIISVGLIMGLGSGLMYCPAILIVTYYFDKYRSLATGITVCGAGVGTAIFSYISKELLRYFDWHTVFLIYAGILMICIPCALVFRPVQMCQVDLDTNKTLDESTEQRHVCRRSSYNAELYVTKSQQSGIIFGDKVQPIINVLPELDESLDENNECLHEEINASNFEDAKSKNEEGNDVSVSHDNSNILKKIFNLFDFSLFQNLFFVAFSFAMFLGSIGYNAFPFFVPLHTFTVFKSELVGSSSVSAYGIGNTIGRIGFGLVCDRKLPFRWGKNCARNRLFIYTLAQLACGIVICLVFIIYNTTVFISFCFFVGASMSSIVCLWSVILVDLVGINKIVNAFGFTLLIQGIASFVGPLIGAMFSDSTGNYNVTFIFYGIGAILGSIITLSLIPMQKKKRNKILPNCT